MCLLYYAVDEKKKKKGMVGKQISSTVKKIKPDHISMMVKKSKKVVTCRSGF